MPRHHMYRHLDDDHDGRRDGDRLTVRLTTREVAERIEAMNYGTQRFLSHLIDVRREALRDRIAKYRGRGDEDIALSVEREGDELADTIEKMLNRGLY